MHVQVYVAPIEQPMQPFFDAVPHGSSGTALAGHAGHEPPPQSQS